MTSSIPTSVQRFDDLARVHSHDKDDFSFIQIGANDGRNGDPLYSLINEFGWRGVLVEPQRWVYENLLVPNYARNQNVRFENAAIGDVDGERELFTIAFSRRRWATGLASFKRSHLQKHIDEGYIDRMIGDERDLLPARIEDYISSEIVRTMTFSTLLATHDVTRIDLLQIDTEGYDHRLLQCFDFGSMRPSIVQFEHHVMTEQERRESLDLLAKHGYSCFREHINIIAGQANVLDALEVPVTVEWMA